MFLKSLLILFLLNPVSAYFSDQAFFPIVNKESPFSVTRINENNVGVLVSADKYVAVDVSTGMILSQKNATEQQALASITKLMTALVILDEKPDWQKVIKFASSDETEGAFAHIYRGEEVLFIDAWKSALIASDNNSIMAMIRSLGFSNEEFVAKMNFKARNIGMEQSVFADPTGLSPQNRSTALDITRLVYTALKKNEIKESVSQGSYIFKILNSGKTRKITSTDILIDSFLNNARYGYNLIGGKTGYLPSAGYCLAVEVAQGDKSVLIVVLNSANITERFQDVKVIADWVFNNYLWSK